MNKLSKVILGTANFITNYGIAKNSGIKEKDFIDIQEICLKNSLKYFDTAPTYGSAINILGKSQIANKKIITKIPSISLKEEITVSEIIEKLSSDMIRLNLESFEGVLFHDSKNLEFLSKTFVAEIVSELKEKNITNKVGISCYNPSELLIALNKFSPDIVQAPINIFDHQMINDPIYDLLKRHNCEIHARSIFLQGLLLDSTLSNKEFFHNYKHLIDEWFEYCLEKDKSPMKICLDYILLNDRIDKVILGFASAGQLREIVSNILADSDEINIDFDCSDHQNLIDPRRWNH